MEIISPPPVTANTTETIVISSEDIITTQVIDDTSKVIDESIAIIKEVEVVKEVNIFSNFLHEHTISNYFYMKKKNVLNAFKWFLIF